MVASNPARGLITGPVDKLTEADSSGLIEAPWASAAVPDLAFSETVGQRPPWSPTRPAPSSQPQKSQVRTGLSAGGDSLERTRLWKPRFLSKPE